MTRRILWRKPETRKVASRQSLVAGVDIIGQRKSHYQRPATSDQRPLYQQRGSALLEFGLILPVFLVLTFGIIDFGRGIWAYNTLSHAAREEARYATVHGQKSRYPASSSEISEIVRSRAAGLHPEQVVVATSWTPNNEPGSVVRVQAQYNFKPVTPLFPPETIVLRSTSRMVISY